MYISQANDYNFLIKTLIPIDDITAKYPDFSEDLFNAVLDEADKFAQNVLAPINLSADKEGAKLENGAVKTAKGLKEAYQNFVNNGWSSISHDKEFGGQGLPNLLSTATFEIFSSANMAFSLCPLLSNGAIELLSKFANSEQKKQYLENLISGKWTGTMCLTEPQAGSDLSNLNTIAQKKDDHYLIKGQKIYITYGDHDFTDNIIHLVLARTKGAPEGVKGISLFIVPKVLNNNETNDIKTISLEHKLGINASPTAVLQFGEENGAIGYLVGEENQGLKYMFTMMNNARHAVGVQGIAMADNSAKKAERYASERFQGGKNIIEHPDVERMLIDINAKLTAIRGLSILQSYYTDIGKNDFVGLLTPIVKSFGSDFGFEASSTAMQVFGGIGYIEETGIAQNLRDARIAMIYEGTNGIQAKDLVFRKIKKDSGKTLDNLLTLLQESIKEGCKDDFWKDNIENQIKEITSKVTTLIEKIIQCNEQQSEYISYNCLNLLAITFGGYVMAKSYLSCIRENNSAINLENKILCCKYYFKNIFPLAKANMEIIENNI